MMRCSILTIFECITPQSAINDYVYVVACCQSSVLLVNVELFKQEKILSKTLSHKIIQSSNKYLTVKNILGTINSINKLA
jgi:hypothetical protein